MLGHVLVNGERDPVANPRHGTDGVGPRTQVRDLAQVLEGVLLGRHRIGIRIIHPADDLDALGLHLESLSAALRRDQRAERNDGATRRQVPHLGLIVDERLVGDHLDGVEAGAVVQVNEREPMPGIAPRSHPALDGDGRVLGSRPVEGGAHGNR